MSINEILERVNLSDSILEEEKNLKTLNLLISAFLQEIPYENLDFFHKKIPSFHLYNVYEKIVENNRGGICYENNTLFAYLLNELGFDVYMIFCKIKDTTYISSDFPHLALIVKLNNKSYLVYVGFGQNVREALDTNNDKYISVYEDIEYYIKENKNTFSLFSRYKNDKENESYSFDLTKVSLHDYENIFDNVRKDVTVPLLVSKASKEGRVTLTDSFLSIKTKDLKRKWEISSENKYEVLRDYFNIHV